MFRDRDAAGRQLAPLLAHLRGAAPLVLALPRGGVPVAAPIAEALATRVDLLLVRKIGAPGNPEYGIGAVADGDPPLTYTDTAIVAALGIDAGYLARQTARELDEIARRRRRYRRDRPPPELRDRTVILVDDGIATGGTVRVALRALARAGAARRVLAAPVAPADIASALRAECDEAVFLHIAEDLGSVGAFYDDFRQLADRDVTALLDRAGA